MTALPPIVADTLRTYGGDAVRGDVAEPEDAEQLAALLAYASSAARAVTFRTGGMAMDHQSVSQDLVVSLRRFGGLSFDEGAASADAGAGVSWGELASGALDRGLFPRVLVTTGRACVGGTTAANGVSRFTPVRGREGRHVLELELVAPSGERLRCAPGENADVLRAALGSLGWLGAITRARVALDRTDARAVRTDVVLVGDAREVLAAITPPFAEGTRYAALMPDLRRGLVLQSRPIAGGPLHPYPFIHQPRSVRRVAAEWLKRWPAWNALIWGIALRAWSTRPYVDGVLDFTFMMDGHLRSQRLGRRLGFSMRLIQQSFLLPGPAAEAFLAEAHRELRERDLAPTLADVLYAPADDSPLSSGYRLDGHLISLAFETSRGARLASAREALVRLSSACRRLGGRVHLVKNVHATPEDLSAMYAAGLPEVHQLKRRLDPRRVLRNHFLERIFPELT